MPGGFFSSQQGGHGEEPEKPPKPPSHGERQNQVVEWNGTEWVPLLTPYGVSDPAIINVRTDLGAPLNGTTDATAFILEAIAALPAAGGEIIIPGPCLISGTLNLNERRSIILRGAGGATAGAAPSSYLIYAPSSEPAIAAKSSYGIKLRDLGVFYTNGAYASDLIDLSHGVAAEDSAYFTASGCYIGGGGSESAKGATSLVTLNKAIICNFRDMIWGAAEYAVRGRNGVGDYSNAITFDNCANVEGALTAGVYKNAGEAWNFRGCTLEGLAAAVAGGYSFDAGVTSDGTTFDGCWLGDATTGTWIKWAGDGLRVVGCYIAITGEAGTGVAVTGNDNLGVEIKGNVFEHLETAMNIEGEGNSGLILTPNAFSAVKNKLLHPHEMTTSLIDANMFKN